MDLSNRPIKCNARSLCLCALTAMMLLSHTADASRINRYFANSVDFARSLHRYTSVDLDAAYYNPAGLVFGREGFGIELTNQATYLQTGFSDTELDRTSAGVAWASPTLNAAYRRGPFALSLFLGPVGGGVPRVEGRHPVFESNKQFVVDSANQMLFNGADIVKEIELSNSFLEARNTFIGGILGVSYRVADCLAVSVALKTIYYDGDIDLRSDYRLDFGRGLIDPQSFLVLADQSGHGFGAIGTVHLKPTHGVDLSIRYESLTSIETTTDVEEQTLEVIQDGGQGRGDVPALAGLGVRLDLPQMLGGRSIPLAVIMSASYVFNDGAEFGEFLGFDITGKLDPDWEAGLGLAFQISPALLLSAGYMFFNSGYNEDSLRLNRYALDAHFAGAGGAYRLTENFEMSAAVFAMIWDETEVPADNATIRQIAWIAGLDASYWF